MKAEPLTEDQKMHFRMMHEAALEIARLVLVRITLDEPLQLDNHPNAWWRHYDKKIDIELNKLIRGRVNSRR